MVPLTTIVASGKGGTGKTLVAANLAFRLKEKGLRVGIIDCDPTNPNLPTLLGISSMHETTVDRLKPVDLDGLKVVSMGLLAGAKPLCMDGSQIQEFLNDMDGYVDWDVDYIVCDLSAGSSDELKAMVKTFSDGLLGSIIVMQPAHRLEAERVIRLHLDNGIPVIGLIENMSFLKVGKARWKIFGESAVDELGAKYKLEVLGKIPLSMDVRKAVEKNKGYLEGESADPIIKAADKLLTLKPQKPGFLARIKAKTREFIEAMLVELVVSINKEIDIKGLGDQYGYPGGRVIRLNLMSDDMDRTLVQADFKLQDGKLLAVENPNRVDTVIDLTPKAFAWSVLGDRVMADGSIYDLETAWYLGEARVFGKGETIRGLHFFKSVWGELRKNQNAINKLRPLLERLA
jgi:Mrp family chromosome partitioning ATPase